MYLGSHLAVGLVIGKLTGDYTFALLGTIGPDVDHVYSYAKHGFFSSFKKFIKIATSEEDPYDDQRNYLHNIFIVTLICLLVFIFSYQIAGAFLFGYLSHLLMDAFDRADYFPLFPNRKINLRGPIGYFSKYDIFISILLLIVFIII